MLDLLSTGLSVHASDWEGSCALHYAAKGCQYRAICLLLTHDAYVNSLNNAW